MSKDEVLRPITCKYIKDMAYSVYAVCKYSDSLSARNPYMQPKINTVNTNQKSEEGKPPPAPLSARSL